MRRTLALAVALTLGLSACGAATSRACERPGAGAEREGRRRARHRRARAATPRRICTEILAKQLVAELKTAGGDCETEMDRAIKDATDYDLQVVSVKVNGANATAQVRQGDDGPVATFTFVKEGDAWKASALGA